MAFDPLQEKNPILWRYFSGISQLYRPSGGEASVRNYLLQQAAALGVLSCVDSAGNVMIRKEADRGFEAEEPIILQGHMDMVCEKRAGTEDPFRVRLAVTEREGQRWLFSESGSLGADNGIALAMGLTLLHALKTQGIQTGRVELLFTVDEECGLTGALHLDPSFLTGRRLINLDSETEGEFCIGCAGGETFRFKRKAERFSVQPELTVYRMHLSGLRGGHSGLNIDKGHANAIVALAKQLTDWVRGKAEFSLLDFQSDYKHNVIPASAELLFAWQGEIPADFESSVQLMLRKTEKTACFSVQKAAPVSPKGFSAAFSSEWMELIGKLPCGVLRQGADGVHTSANPCKMKVTGDEILGEISLRSMEAAALAEEKAALTELLESYGWTVEGDGGYPCWTPDAKSPWVEKIAALWQTFTGQPPRIGVIHAGLECGVLGEKLPNTSMISLGPTLTEVHSPNERLCIESAERVYDFVEGVVSGRWEKRPISEPTN